MRDELCKKDKEVVVMGGSFGSIEALQVIIASFPAACRARIVIALHQYRHGADGLAQILARQSALPVMTINDKDRIHSGRIYVAPANYHLLLEADETFSLNTDAPVQFARPSLDVFFESAALVYGDRLAAALLSGASADGALGLRAVKERGGWVACQDPATAVSPIMPQAGMEAVKVDCVGSPQVLGERMATLCL